MNNAEFKAQFMKSVEEGTQILLQFPWSDREAYSQWMAQTYFFVRHTPRLLCVAGGRIPAEDRLSFDGIVTYLKEEENHDQLLAKDLKALGYDVQDFKPNTTTDVLVQTQYYWTQNHHPASYLGYAVFLEGIACMAGPKIASTVQGLYGKKASTFIHVHAVVDQNHFPDAMKAIENTPQEAREAILGNLKQSQYLYAEILNEIKVGLRKSKAA